MPGGLQSSSWSRRWWTTTLSTGIGVADRVIANVCIEICSSAFMDRVSIDEPAEAGTVSSQHNVARFAVEFMLSVDRKPLWRKPFVGIRPAEYTKTAAAYRSDMRRRSASACRLPECHHL